MEGEPRFPYPSFRPGQKQVAELVRKTVEEGGVLYLKAPTGFGKTAAVIYGLLLARAERVLYVVRTRNELEPVVRELSRFGARFSILYSARRMCPLLKGEKPPPPDEFWENCRLLRLKGACKYYENLVELKDVKGPVLRAIERGSPSPYRIVEEIAALGLCPFFALKSVIDDVNFVVATYPYLFKPDIFESVFEPHDYSDFVVVVDEAHSLMDAGSMMEERLRLRDVEAFRVELERYARDSTWGFTVAERLSSLIRRLRPPPEGRLRRINKALVLEAVEDPGALADLAAEIRVEKFREALSAGSSAASVRVAAARVAAFASIASLEGVEVFVARGKGGEPELRAIPVDQCIVTREPLNKARAAILMSGTLPPERFMRDVLCIERRASTFDAELVYGASLSGRYYAIVTVELTSRYDERSEEMYTLYARYIDAVASETPGITLAVYPSYELLEKISSRLSGVTPHVEEGRESSIDEVRGEALRLLEEKGRVIVNAVAGGKLVEGVEFTRDGGSLVHAVFLAGVPYPQPDDYTRSVVERLEEKVGREQAEYYVFTVQAYVKARQALGRAIRGPEDRALYILGDRRYLSRKLRELMRLHYHRVVYDLESFTNAVKEGLARLGLKH